MLIYMLLLLRSADKVAAGLSSGFITSIQEQKRNSEVYLKNNGIWTNLKNT